MKCTGICGILAFGQVLAGGSIYEVYDLGQLGGNAAAAYGINSTGTTTGGATDVFGNIRAVSAPGAGAGWSVLGGANPATASDLNGAGVIAGTQYVKGAAYATRWTDGSPQIMGGAGSYSTGINEGGQITGMTTVDGQGRAFVTMAGGAVLDMGVPAGGLWSAGYDVNASGKVAGYAMSGGGFRAFVWTEESGYVTIGTFGGQNSYAMAVNDAGVAAGHAQGSNGHLRAFTWDGAAMRDLGSLGGGSSYAYDINAAGQVVGYSWAGGTPHAFLYQGVMLDLNSLIDPGSEWVLTHAYAINDGGQIAGSGVYRGQEHGFRLDLAGAQLVAVAEVPEPSTWVLAVLGVSLCAAGLWRRRKAGG